MAPQQRILLETSHRALENGKIVPSRFAAVRLLRWSCGNRLISI